MLYGNGNVLDPGRAAATLARIDDLGVNWATFIDEFEGSASASLRIWLNNLGVEGVTAWSSLHVRNVPSVLKLNRPFLTRLANNPPLLNLIDAYPPSSWQELGDNIGTWVKHYDARAYLKDGGVDGAISQLGGVRKSILPDAVHRGKDYVLPLVYFPTDFVNLEKMLDAIDDLVMSGTSVGAISGELGISPNIVSKAMDHMLIDYHVVEAFPGNFRYGRFQVASNDVKLWHDVANGVASNDVKARLRQLIAHEYIESRLMEAGMVYRRIGAANIASYGAHELSILDDWMTPTPWRHYYSTEPGGLGRNNPNFNLNADFSNIDDIVDSMILTEGL